MDQDFEAYWNGVIGPHRSPEDAVREFDLVGDAVSLSEWLGAAEAEAAMQGCNVDDDGSHHDRAVGMLLAACEVAQ